MNEKTKLQLLLTDNLLPTFPQAKLSEVAPRNSNKVVSWEQGYARTGVRFQLSCTSDFAFVISRSQAFDKSERNIMGAFMQVVQEIMPHLDEHFGPRLKEMLIDRVVAKALSTSTGGRVPAELIERTFIQFQAWAQETYEGRRIASAVGFTDNAQNGHISYRDYMELNLAKVIADGCSTLSVFSLDDHFVEHKYLGQADENDGTFSPFAYIPMAKWTSAKNCAIALNRNGEVLVFSNKSLLFARRRGHWCQFSHDAAIKQMSVGGPLTFDQNLRRAAYLTALDVSFARVGGGIGLIRRKKKVVGIGLPVQERDVLRKQETPKTKALAALIGERKFQDLGRPLRQEIGGVDGAVVVEHDGTIIAAGAVLAVSICSDEGARRTAAKRLGGFGLGIKVSSDGKIEAYGGSPSPQQEPLFEFG